MEPQTGGSRAQLRKGARGLLRKCFGLHPCQEGAQSRSTRPPSTHGGFSDLGAGSVKYIPCATNRHPWASSSGTSGPKSQEYSWVLAPRGRCGESCYCRQTRRHSEGPRAVLRAKGPCTRAWDASGSKTMVTVIYSNTQDSDGQRSLIDTQTVQGNRK